MSRKKKRYGIAFADLTCRSNGGILHRGSPRRPLRETATEYLLGDPIFHHLDRPTRDHPAACAPQAVFGEALRCVTEPPKNLDRLVGHVETDLVAHHLGDRGLVSRRQSTLRIGSGAIEKKLCGIEVHRHLGDLPLDALEFAKRAAELATVHRMLARQIEGVASDCERASGIADALCVEAFDLALETSGRQQHLPGSDPAVLKVELAPSLAAHEAALLAERKARCSPLDQHRADAVDPLPEPDINEKQRRVRTVGREDFGAIDPEALAVRGRRCFQIGGCGSGFGLRHAQRDHLLACEELREIALLLLGTRIFGKGAERPEIAGLHRIGAAWAHERDLLDRDHGIHQRTALPAIGLRHGDPEQPLLGQHPGRVPWKARSVRPLQRVGREIALSKAAHCIAEGFLLGCKLEIHRALPETASFSAHRGPVYFSWTAGPQRH